MHVTRVSRAQRLVGRRTVMNLADDGDVDAVALLGAERPARDDELEDGGEPRGQP